jgi:hypothetical protein
VVAELLRTGLHDGGLADSRIETVLREAEAIHRAADCAGPHDLLVVLSDTVPETLRLVDALAGAPAADAPGRGATLWRYATLCDGA